MRFHIARRRAALVLAGFVASLVAVLAPAAEATTAPTLKLVETGASPSAPAVNPVTNKIYVPNMVSDTLSVIDGRTDEVTSVPTSHIPQLVLVNPRTNGVFVLTADGLDVIDGRTNKIIRTIAKLSGRLAAVNTATNRVYVTGKRSYQLYEYDADTNTVEIYSIGGSPSALAVNERTGKVYVASKTGDQVTIIDATTRKSVSVGTGSKPAALAVNPVTNKVYVANSGEGSGWFEKTGRTITVIDGATNKTSGIRVDVAPVALAVNTTNNRLYLVSETTFALTVIDGARMKVIGSVPAVGVGGLAVDERTDQVYVGAAPHVAVVDARAMTKVRIDAGGRQQSSVAINTATGRAYINNPGSGNVAILG